MPARRLALVPVLGLLLAGCTGASGEPPRTLPPVSPSPWMAASPSAVAVEVPAEARAETPQGAAAFARFYLAEVERAFASGDSRTLRSLSHPSCNTCNDYIRITEEGRTAGTRFEGGKYTVRSSAAPAFTGDDVVVDLLYDLSAATEYDSEGQVLGRAPAQVGVLAQLRVIHEGGRWKARGLRFPEGPA